MSTPCKIERTLTGDPTEILRKIEYIKSELEKVGLNVEIRKLSSSSTTLLSGIWNERGIYSPFEILFGIRPALSSSTALSSSSEEELKDPMGIENPYKVFKDGVDKYRIKGGGIKYLRYRMKWIKIEIEVS